MALTKDELRELVLETLQEPGELLITEVVHVPEWHDADVIVRVLNTEDRDWFEWFVSLYTAKDKPVPNFRAEFLRLAICDDKGAKVFARSEVDKIGALPTPGTHRVFDAASKLNKLDPDAVKKAEKNSGSAAISDSGTTSPRTSECQSSDADEK